MGSTRALSTTIAIAAVVAVIAVVVVAWYFLGRSSPETTMTTTTQQPTTTMPQTTTTMTQTTPQQTQTTTQTATRPKTTVITGSGSTFVAPQMYAWANQLKEKYGWVIVEYESVGSGAGLSNFLQRVRDFGASDPPMPKKAWEENRGKVVQMPVIIGAIVVFYNIPGVDKPLNLTGEVLARIYKGEIEYWDDPAIASLNPAVKLPHEKIIAVHRSDAGGSTEIFTTFLYKSAPNIWPKTLVGKTINWPVDATGRGVGAKGSEGVTQSVKSTLYSIGYAEWSYALDAGLPVAAIQNPAGEYVLPTIESIQKAVKGVTLPQSPLDDYSAVVEQLVYANATGAYPLASFTFLFFWTEYPREKLDAIKTLIEYINGEGQNEKNIVKGYIPIPPELRKLNLMALDYIKATG